MQFSREFFDELVRRTTAVVYAERIIVFGSAVEGGFGRDSDIDVLIVTAEADNTRHNRVRIREALRGFGVPIDVLMISARRFEDTKDVIGGIAYPAHKHGEVLYEAA